MCGGLESKFSGVGEKKEKFTDIELGLLEEVVLIILKAFESAWSEIIEIETEIDYLESNPQMVQSMSPNEPVILTSFVIETFGNKSFINICLPYVSLENIIDKLSIKNWFEFEKESDGLDKTVLIDKIKGSIVNLDIALGESSITVDDFLQLEVGDVLQLDTNISDPLKMYVEDMLHYLVKPGVFNGKLAVEVLQYIEGDVEK